MVMVTSFVGSILERGCNTEAVFGHHGAMGRRNRRQSSGNERPLSLAGSHWRADGAAKSRFASKADALGAANQRWIEDKVELSVYRCEYCNGWHLGRSSQD